MLSKANMYGGGSKTRPGPRSRILSGHLASPRVAAWHVRIVSALTEPQPIGGSKGFQQGLGQEGSAYCKGFRRERPASGLRSCVKVVYRMGLQALVGGSLHGRSSEVFGMVGNATPRRCPSCADQQKAKGIGFLHSDSRARSKTRIGNVLKWLEDKGPSVMVQTIRWVPIGQLPYQNAWLGLEIMPPAPGQSQAER